MDGKKPVPAELVSNSGRDSMSGHCHLICPALHLGKTPQATSAI
jgi:hypothetical protein